MNTVRKSRMLPFHALTVVSPACMNGEVKDQDRAQWYSSNLTACLADGTTSSPHGGLGAEMVVKLAPVIFQGNLPQRMEVLADYLMNARSEALQAGVKLPKTTPLSLRPLLEEVANEKLEHSYQTTLVAVRFIPQHDCMHVEGVYCGDSTFFAFSPQGELLMSSIWDFDEWQKKTTVLNVRKSRASEKRFIVDPGDELAVKNLGEIGNYPRLIRLVKLDPHSSCRWMICTVEHILKHNTNNISRKHNKTALYLRHGDILLVPDYLLSNHINNFSKDIYRLNFSNVIRPVWLKYQKCYTSFQNHGVTTAVLPDHIYSGQWNQFQERFPLDTHFMLGSDGFYGSFSTADELWNWLNENKYRLQTTTMQEQVLQELHMRLTTHSSDDDISFIWISPGHPSFRKVDGGNNRSEQ